MRPATQPGGTASVVTFSRFATSRCATVAGSNVFEPAIGFADRELLQRFGHARECAPSMTNVRHRSLAYIRRVFDERDADQLRHCFVWRSLGESNPCFSLERGVTRTSANVNERLQT
jgi:hypothetical protein